MKAPTVLRLLAGAGVLLLAGWLVTQTRWVEVDVPDDPRGLARTDSHYSLRRLVEGLGGTLEIRNSLEPLPPADATLLLESSLWDIFPERDARLRAWVEHGGHLVLMRQHGSSESMHWVPITFAAPPERNASAAGDEDDDNARRRRPLLKLDKKPKVRCSDFQEAQDSTPSFEPGRTYRGCAIEPHALRPLGHTPPAWKLGNEDGALALRIPLGRGDVTGVSTVLPIENRTLLRADNAFIAAAILQAAPGRAVWIVDDEKRESLAAWVWSEARTPLLLALAAIALALWRLAVRFGPRVALPPRARRSMGEQVRGTGQFIAATDARALHAATRQAFEDVARTRVQAWNERDDADRIAALADTFAPAQALDRAALLASLNIGASATTAQILTAIAVLEQARRALLRAPASPPAP